MSIQQQIGNAVPPVLSAVMAQIMEECDSYHIMGITSAYRQSIPQADTLRGHAFNEYSHLLLQIL